MFHVIRQSANRTIPCNDADVVTRRSFFSRMFALVTTFAIPDVMQTRTYAAKVDPKTGRAFYKIVSYEVPQEHWQDFLEACRVNADASLKEPGITSFEVLISKDATNTVIAVEGYKDEDASKAHQQTEHFHAFVQGVQKFGVKRSVIAATRYYPN